MGFWAAIGPGRRLLGTGSREEALAKAQQEGVLAPILWHVTRAIRHDAAHQGLAADVATVPGAGTDVIGLTVRIHQSCPRCQRDLGQAGVAQCPHCGNVLFPEDL